MMKVLIIEDELELLNNLASYLSSFDKEFEVLTAPSGEEGLVVLESNSELNLLLTDVRLPGIDGIEVVRRTVESRPDVKVVVMTAFGSPELRRTAESEGALKYIEKPVDLDALPSTLREVHESHQRRSHPVGGLSILDVAEFVAMARETKVIRFQNERGKGTLVFENGTMVHCATGKVKGTDAFLEMALWGEGSFCELFDVETRRYRKNVDIPTSKVLKQASGLSAALDGEDQFETDASFPPEPETEKASALEDEPKTTRPRDTPTSKHSTETINSMLTTKEEIMADLESELNKLMGVGGAIGVALVDFESGMCISSVGGTKDLNIELAAAGNVEVVRAKKIARDSLGIPDKIEDILITLDNQYHLIRMLHSSTTHFFYFVLDRKKANLALARMEMHKADDNFKL